MSITTSTTMDFSEEVESLLQDKDYESALGLIFNPSNQSKVLSYGMDLITRLCEYGLAFCPENDALVACQDMLMHVVRTVRPKEALISLLEQAEMFVHKDSSKFASLLAPLQHVMLNLPRKREHSFSWVLSILNSHIKSQHKFPPNFKRRLMTGREALLLEENQQIKDTLLIYKQFCNFYDPFVRQFWVERGPALSGIDKDAMASIQRQQDILRDHLVQLLGDPLLHFDLHWEEPPPKDPSTIIPSDKVNVNAAVIKTEPRLIAERLMGFLRLVDPNPHHFCDWSSKKLYLERAVIKTKPIYTGDDNVSDDEGDPDDCAVDFSSVINYFYLIHVQNLNKDALPSIHSPPYLFTSTAAMMYPVLSNDKASPISLHKCLRLAQRLLQNLDPGVPDLRLESSLLETSVITDFIEGVAYHTVYCEEVPVRQEGLQVLRQLMWKFEPKGRYDFILFIFNRIEHDGVKGYVTTQLKDCVRLALEDKGQRSEMREYFTGNRLHRLVKLTCYLRHGVTTDLMEHKEQIMCALNLILFLALRDNTGQLSGVGGFLGEVRAKLLEPLFRGLELSRAHYQLKLKELEDPKKVEEEMEAAKKKKKELEEEVDLVMANGEGNCPEASVEEQKSVVRGALGQFDVMNGVLARVNEVCDGMEKRIKSSN